MIGFCSTQRKFLRLTTNACEDKEAVNVLLVVNPKDYFPSFVDWSKTFGQRNFCSVEGDQATESTYFLEAEDLGPPTFEPV